MTDTNDEMPAFIFSQYDVTIAENAPVNTTVATLQAFDPDLSSEVVFLYSSNLPIALPIFLIAKANKLLLYKII